MFLGFGIGKILKAAKSVTGIAKKVTGTVKGFSSVLKTNPSLMSLVMPPQVQAGLAIANTVSSALDLKVPSSSEVGVFKNVLNGLTQPNEEASDNPLDNALGGLRNTVVSQLDKIIGLDSLGVTLEKVGDTLEAVNAGLDTVEETLNKIQWLL